MALQDVLVPSLEDPAGSSKKMWKRSAVSSTDSLGPCWLAARRASRAKLRTSFVCRAKTTSCPVCIPEDRNPLGRLRMLLEDGEEDQESTSLPAAAHLAK